VATISVPLDVDPFDDAFLNNPYPIHEQIREAGAVVYLERYGVYASARHAEVVTGLSTWETFSSAAGVGLDDFRLAKPWRPPSLILEADPPLHTRSRTVLNRALSAKAMAALRARFEAAAERLADALIGRGEIDAIAEIAEAYPLSVFPGAIGLGPEGLENLLPYGSMAFNAFGPRNKHFEASMRDASRVVGWINAQCAREALAPDGLGAVVWAAVDTGEISAEEAPLLVRSMLTAGLDTTIIGIGNALYALAANPGEWTKLRDNPALVRPAFDEMLRFESPVQTFFRTTTRMTELGSVALPQDAKILLFLAGANRDPRRWEAPDRFDVTRKAGEHTAFGAGIHKCVGQMLARLETEMILSALLRRFATIEIAGEPTRKLNNTLRQFARLPIRFAQG
jgi:4-methoxybenzoate monooxygenase (O-demethylating)